MPESITKTGKKCLSILIVDDSEDDYVLMRDMLEDLENYRVNTVWCKGYADGLIEAMGDHDVCLIDYILGGKDGVQLIEDAVAAGCQSPMIIFTARGNHHVDIDAMNKGAVDYLTKGEFSEALLERTIRYAMDRKRAELELAAANASLEERVAERTRELNQANAKLERRQHTLQTLLNNAPVAIWMADANRKVHFVNQTFLDVQGIDKNEILAAQDYYRLLPTKIRKTWKDSDAACFQRGLVHSREHLSGKGGSVHIFDVVRAKVMGEADRLVGIAIDVTRQLELQAQMEHAQRLESLGVLAGGIAHDFNNLLAIIMANAGLAQRSLEQTESVSDALNKIIHASQRAADLCKQMMTYAGKGECETHVINLSELVTSMNDLMRISISRNISIKHDFSEKPLAVKADQTQIQQVLMNLVINAAEAIGENSPGQITIKTGTMQADRDYLRGAVSDDGAAAGEYYFAEVADDGCGMNEETSDHLFDPFFTTKFSGRGLGMSAILGIIRNHHGAIKVDSEIAKGTTIRVLFPIARLAQQIPVIADEFVSGWRGNGTALIVDDEPDVRELASVLMEGMGFDVLEAENGLVAIEEFHQNKDKISVVLLDLTMPGMDGEACFRELRAMNPDLRVVLSSGYSKNEVATRFAGKGVTGFVQKPYSLDAFEEIIEAAFSDD
ncbi:MAG: response regulator [Mariprofundaceae bacterium]